MSGARLLFGLKGGGDAESVEVYGPPRGEDLISECLRFLTWFLSGGEDCRGGFLGGEYGYGMNHESDTFLMHRYCWCESADCDWCMCGDQEDFMDRLGSRFGTTDYQQHEKRHYYDPPNFWHKASDFRVTWYKYIGRDMATNRDIAGPEWVAIVEECWRSAGGDGSLEDAWAEYVEAQERSERAEREAIEAAIGAAFKMEAAEREAEAEAGCSICARVGGPLVECAVCGQRKCPRGRDAPMAGGSYCDSDCPGYSQAPRPEELWPGERYGDSLGHMDWHEGAAGRETR